MLSNTEFISQHESLSFDGFLSPFLRPHREKCYIPEENNGSFPSGSH